MIIYIAFWFFIFLITIWCCWKSWPINNPTIDSNPTSQIYNATTKFLKTPYLFGDFGRKPTSQILIYFICVTVQHIPSSLSLSLSLSLSHTKTFARSTLAFCNLSRETEIQGVGTWNKSPCISIHTSRIEFPLQQISFHQIQLLPSSQTASAFRAEKDGGSSIANREYPISRSRRKRRTAPIFAERSLTSRRVIREQVQSALFFRRLSLMKSLDRVRHVDRVRPHLVLYQTARLRTESAVRSPSASLCFIKHPLTQIILQYYIKFTFWSLILEENVTF